MKEFLFIISLICSISLLCIISSIIKRRENNRDMTLQKKKELIFLESLKEKNK